MYICCTRCASTSVRLPNDVERIGKVDRLKSIMPGDYREEPSLGHCLTRSLTTKRPRYPRFFRRLLIQSRWKSRLNMYWERSRWRTLTTLHWGVQVTVWKLSQCWMKIAVVSLRMYFNVNTLIAFIIVFNFLKLQQNCSEIKLFVLDNWFLR